jgi:hypothetical protein
MRSLHSAVAVFTLALAGCSSTLEPTPGESSQALDPNNGDFGWIWSWDAYRITQGGNTLNSAGGINLNTPLGSGSYRVDFPLLGGSGGNVQVVQSGSQTNVRCKVGSWYPNGTTENVIVNCHDPSGAPAPAVFNVLFYRAPTTQGGGAKTNYLWNANPYASSTPPATYQFNGSGGTNTVARYGVGSYGVTIPTGVVSDNGGNAQVTAYGSNATYCKVGYWYHSGLNQVVGVLCFDTTGAPIDSQFSFLYTADYPSPSHQGGYAWCNQTSGSYTPPTPYNRNSAGTLNTVQVSGSLQMVTLPGVHGNINNITLTTAVGLDNHYCIVNNTTLFQNTYSGLNSECFDANGTHVVSPSNVMLLNP